MMLLLLLCALLLLAIPIVVAVSVVATAGAAGAATIRQVMVIGRIAGTHLQPPLLLPRLRFAREGGSDFPTNY